MEGTDFDLFYVHLNGDYPGRGGIPAHLQLRPSGHCGALPGARRAFRRRRTFFDVLLHLGTLVAVFAAYWQDIRDMIVELIDGVRDLVRGTTPNPIPPARRMILLIIVGTLAPVCGAAGEGSGGGPVRQYLFRGGGSDRDGLSAVRQRPGKKRTQDGAERQAAGCAAGGHCPGHRYLPRHLPLRHHYHRRLLCGL